MPTRRIPAEHQRTERAGERAGERVPEPERQRERRDAARHEQPVDEHEVGIGEQVGRELVARRGRVAEHPAHVGVEEAAPTGERLVAA